MSDENQIIPVENSGKESTILHVSLRGWITILVVATVCVMSILAREIKEPLYTLAGLVVGYYFGQKVPNANPTGKAS